MLITDSNDAIKLEIIKCFTQIFDKEPFLVIKSSESGLEFLEIIESIKDANPEMALAAIEFWSNFVV